MSDDLNTEGTGQSEDSTKGTLEIGDSGLKRQSGMIFEEALRELQGSRKHVRYTEMGDNDPIIGGILLMIEMLIRQIDMRVNPASESPEDVEKADFLETCRNDMEGSWEEFIAEVTTMFLHGFAPHEIVYKLRNGHQPHQLDKPVSERLASSKFTDGKIGWKKIPLRGQDTISRWELADNGDIEGLWQIRQSDMKEIFIPITKIILFRTTTKKNNPEGRSIVRNAFRSYFFKTRIENFEGIGVERDLAGLPIVWIPTELLDANASAEEKATLVKFNKMVTNIRRDEQEGIVMPLEYDDNGNKVYDLSLLSASGARQFKTNEIINRYDSRIGMSMLADFIMMGHEKVGSFALASSKTNMLTLAIKGWMDCIVGVLNRTLVPQLFLLNGESQENLPFFSYGDVETVDLDALGAYVTSLTGAGIDLSGEAETAYLKGQGNIPSSDIGPQ